MGRLLREPQGKKDLEGRHVQGEAASVRAANSLQHMGRLRGRGSEERQGETPEDGGLPQLEGLF